MGSCGGSEQIRIIGFLADDRCQNRSIINTIPAPPPLPFSKQATKKIFFSTSTPMSLPSACRCHNAFQPLLPRYFGYSQKGMTGKNYLEKWYPFHVSVQYHKIHQKTRFSTKNGEFWVHLEKARLYAISLNFRAKTLIKSVEFAQFVFSKYNSIQCKCVES